MDVRGFPDDGLLPHDKPGAASAADEAQSFTKSRRFIDSSP
jgi:hypothetical protein